MLSPKSVLAIGAHPDDIEYGCLGFLLKMSAKVEKHLFVGSMGSAGDSSSGAHRLSESKSALASIAPQSISLREKAGIFRENFEEIMGEMYSLIERSKPDLILTHSCHDTHQEHREIYEMTIAAARRSKATILSYGILSNTLDFKPQLFVDIGEVYDQKIQALRCHQSQSSKFYMNQEHLDIFHVHNYSSLHGVRYCEAYEIVRMFA